MTLPRPGSVFKGLSLRGRFALLSAVSVSVAIIIAALASYFLVSSQLNNQVDNNLARQGAFQGPPMAADRNGNGNGGDNRTPTVLQAQQRYTDCQGSAQQGTGQDGVAAAFGTGVISPTGSVCWEEFPGGLLIPASSTQTAVANGTIDTSAGGIFYDAYAPNGEHVRVFVIQAAGGTGWAFTSVGTLSNVDSSLSSLTIWLILAAVGGVGVAAVAGLFVARSAVKPVRRLTRAVEHVARTEDLSFKLSIDGKDEISRLGTAFNKMTKALATSRDRQRQLIADAGHELRTPLTSMRTNVDLLLRSQRTGRELPEGRRETMLVSVDQQLHELSGLVTDLLELSRGQEGGTRRTMRVALHESVGRAIERARLRGPGLYFDVAVEPWFVQGDPTAVDRAVVNLLDNAVKFSPAGGTVIVRLHAGEYAVTDQGPGIDPSDLPHVFERFWRSDSARSLPGSGLGLAIVSQVAEESGGKVTLQPAPDGGTIARLWLPGEPGGSVVDDLSSPDGERHPAIGAP